MEIKVSIIVPVYNVEKYLDKCIESLINQTYKNLEIILVDDGSPDNCPKMCDDYKKKDNRIKVIHQKNSGLSEARNSGIKNATGDYLFFVDSDDYIELDTIEYLLGGIKKYDCKIVCCGLSNIYMNGKKEKVTIPNQDVIYNKEEALNIHLLPGFIEDITCNKLFARELFNDIKWPKGLLYEDMRTTYKLLEKTDKIVLMPESKYNYCKRSDSIGGTSFSKNTLDLLNACDEAVEYVSSNYDVKPILMISQIHWYIVVLNKMILSNNVDLELVKKIKKMIHKVKYQVLKTKYLDKIRKIQIILLWFNFSLYKFAYVKYIEKNR